MQCHSTAPLLQDVVLLSFFEGLGHDLVTVDAADFEGEPRKFTVAMQGSTQSMAEHVHVDGRRVNDPAVYADIVYVLELLGEAAGRALYTDDVSTA